MRDFTEIFDRVADKANKAAGLDALARHAEAIRALRQRTARDIIKIGERLTAARKLCTHGNWRPWLEREFGWTDDTARNFMRVFELSKSEHVPDLNLPLRSLCVLARPSTPETVRREVLDRAERGEPPSHVQVKTAVEAARPKTATAAPTCDIVPSLPTQDEIINQIIDLFTRLDRQSQNRCALRLRNIIRGST